MDRGELDVDTLPKIIRPRTDIARDKVQNNIQKEADEAVEYLKKREAFWEIVNLGKDDDTNYVVESYRSFM